MKQHKIIFFMLLLNYCNSATAQQVNEERLSSVTCQPVNVDQTYTFLLDTLGSWNNSMSCLSLWGYGEEVVLKFTAPCTNTFILEIFEPYDPNLHPVAIRNSTGNCTPGGFTCLTAISTVYLGGPYKITYEFSAIQGIVYDILIEYDYPMNNYQPAPLTATIKTPHIQNINFPNITPDSLSIAWTGTFDEVVLEYGPNGFIPGLDTTPGVLGIIVAGITSPFTISGLNNDSSYNFYLRDRCGNSYSGNSPVFRILIPQPDSLITQINPCPNSGFIGLTHNSYALHPCSWLNVNCGSGCLQSSPEIIRKFVPDSSGFHIITKLGQGTTDPYLSCFYKDTASGLNASNWNCIGGGLDNVPWSHSFGPLVAGTPYYIMVKATQDLPGCSSPGMQYNNFNIECQGTCPIISNHNVINPTTSSLTFLMRQGSTLGYFIIEYGLSGFVPGTDSLPGIGGTIITTSVVYNNIIISGLLPGTTYDFYFRQFCNVTGSFSPNSTVKSGTTFPICSIAPDSITTNRTNNAICVGQSITLTQNGGLLSPGASFRWYKDSCNSIQIGTGNVITVYPDSSRNYFVKPVDTCVALPCAQIFVTVNPIPQITLTNPTLQDICVGDTVLLQATVDSSWIYTWMRNGVNLNAANLPTFNATSGGFYSVVVNDTNNCTNTSQISRIRVICFPPIDPIERLSLFERETNNSILVSPNPSTGIFNCLFSEQITEFRLSVYNTFGERIIVMEMDGESEHDCVDLSNQPIGIYLLIIETSYQVFSQKLFIIAE